MHLLAISIAAALAMSVGFLDVMPAAAQTPNPPENQMPAPAPPKAYKPMAVTLTPQIQDPGLDALRKQLADIVQRKDRAALTRLVAAKGFFWEREQGNAADENKSGIDNLAAAIGLDAKDGSGWELLADYAAEPSVSPVGDRKDFVCAPAAADFNESEFENLLRSTETHPGEWGFPMNAGIEVRDSASPDVKPVEKLGLHLVRVLPDEATLNAATPMLKIVLPSGKLGYVAADSISPLGIEQLCYIQQADGWKIAGYIGEGAQE